MIIFKKQYENARAEDGIKEDEIKALLDEADALIARAKEGVKSERSPITIVEKVQISDTTKQAEKLIIDISKDIRNKRPADKNCEKLKKAVIALRTSIENIL